MLLLDEPTFGVDPISRRDLWLIVHEMVAEGVTAIVSTAYLDEAERCDRVAMLSDGRLLALETPEALRDRLAGQVYAVRAAEPRRARAVLQAHPAVRHAVLFGDAVHVTLADAHAPWTEVRASLARDGVTLLADDPVEPSLEDVFIDLTRPGAA